MRGSVVDQERTGEERRGAERRGAERRGAEKRGEERIGAEKSGAEGRGEKRMFNFVRSYMELAQSSVQTLNSLLLFPLPLDQNAIAYVNYVYGDYKCDSNLRSICPRMDFDENETCATNGLLCG
eukprot:767793-Hanusia_phi.AAC.5